MKYIVHYEWFGIKNTAECEDISELISVLDRFRDNPKIAIEKIDVL